MRTKRFTLVELLVVIAVILVLAGLLVPAVYGAIKKAELSKAKTAIVTLQNAIKQYESTYGKLPLSSSMTKAQLTDAQYKWLILLLQADGDHTSDLPVADLNKYNPKKIKFLEVQGNEPGKYQDPWDQNLGVAFDHDYDGKINGSDASVPGISGTIYYSVAIWSIGPDGEFASGNDKKNADNVYSFNTNFDKSNNTVTIIK